MDGQKDVNKLFSWASGESPWEKGWLKEFSHLCLFVLPSAWHVDLTINPTVIILRPREESQEAASMSVTQGAGDRAWGSGSFSCLQNFRWELKICVLFLLTCTYWLITIPNLSATPLVFSITASCPLQNFAMFSLPLTFSHTVFRASIPVISSLTSSVDSSPL